MLALNLTDNLTDRNVSSSFNWTKETLLYRLFASADGMLQKAPNAVCLCVCVLAFFEVLLDGNISIMTEICGHNFIYVHYIFYIVTYIYADRGEI